MKEIRDGPSMGWCEVHKLEQFIGRKKLEPEGDIKAQAFGKVTKIGGKN